MLLAFLEAPQRPLSREQLLQATRVHEDVFDRSIDVQILRLRRKLEPDPRAPRVIRTKRGVGYVFAVPVVRVRILSALVSSGLATCVATASLAQALPVQMPARMGAIGLRNATPKHLSKQQRC